MDALNVTLETEKIDVSLEVEEIEVSFAQPEATQMCDKDDLILCDANGVELWTNPSLAVLPTSVEVQI